VPVRRHLHPGGLVVVSYNALPGWAHLLPIRGILRQYAALRQGDSIQRIRDGLAYLVFLRQRQARYFTDNPAAAAYVDSLLKQDPRYLAHEYLHEHWTSFYFAEMAAGFARAGLSFAGSMPIHTNFWDLCVRPEFQDLFRTTTDRLVSEAHKDFCANTAFRWDIYVKSPRLLATTADRDAVVGNLHVRIARPGLKLPYSAELGAVTSTLHGPLYEALLAVLAPTSRPLSSLVADELLAGFSGEEVARSIDAGLATGLFDLSARAVPGPPAVIPQRVTIPCLFNRAVLTSDALGGGGVALASQLTGTGHTIGDFEAAILLEFAAGGSVGLAQRVEARMQAAGRSLHHQGTPVSDANERRRLVEQATAAFLSTTLPHLLQLGIVAAA
jgi:hypothetical protein